MTNPYRLQDGGVLVIGKDGNIVKVAPNDASCIVPDGGKVSVPMMLMDGKSKDAGKAPVLDIANHRPREGVRSMADRARVDMARIMNEKRTADAWRGGDNAGATEHARQNAVVGNKNWRTGLHSNIAEHFAAKEQPEAFEREQSAYDKQKERLQNAWRNPKTKP
jgi:hypothetical protein